MSTDLKPGSGPPTEFDHAGHECPKSLIAEFRVFIFENKKWWLLPILLALSVMGLLAVLSSTGAAPFIYTLF